MTHYLERPRSGTGKFIPSPNTARRDAEAAELRAQGRSFSAIANELGYSDKGAAWRGVARAMDSIVREPAQRLIDTEAAKLDELYVEALDVLEADHLMVSHGKIIYDTNGQPLQDSGPRLAAIRELRQIRESYRKLHGLDAPSRVSVDAQNIGADILRLLDGLTAGGDDDDADS